MQEINKISDKVDAKLGQFETKINDLNATVNTLKQQQDLQGTDLEILTGIVDDIKENQNTEEIGFLKQLLEKDEDGKFPFKEYLTTLKAQLSEKNKFNSDAEKIINHNLQDKNLNRDVFEKAKNKHLTFAKGTHNALLTLYHASSFVEHKIFKTHEKGTKQKICKLLTKIANKAAPFVPAGDVAELAGNIISDRLEKNTDDAIENAHNGMIAIKALGTVTGRTDDAGKILTVSEIFSRTSLELTHHLISKIGSPLGFDNTTNHAVYDSDTEEETLQNIGSEVLKQIQKGEYKHTGANLHVRQKINT